MSNDINTLREALFVTLAGLQNRTTPMDLDRARAINETGQVIINSVKAEADYLKATGQHQGSDFIKPLEHAENPLRNPAISIAAVPGGTITTHRIK